MIFKKIGQYNFEGLIAEIIHKEEIVSQPKQMEEESKQS